VGSQSLRRISFTAFAAAKGEEASAGKTKALLTAMLAAEPEGIRDGTSGARVIKLPAGVRWPQLGAVLLFVRQFYEDCYEHVMGKLEPGKRFTVRGNAGGESRRSPREHCPLLC